MKVLVCGGRDYKDKALVYRFLDNLHKKRTISQIIHGDANGADNFAGSWAFDNNVLCIAEEARWGDIEALGAVIKTNRFGKPYNVVAGFQRNQIMADMKPDVCLAFGGGSGTNDMVNRYKAVTSREAIIIG